MHKPTPSLLIFLFICLITAGCSSGPEKAINTAANALKNKDSEAFSSAVDIKSYLEISLTEQKEAYRKAMGSILGSNAASQAMQFADSLLPQNQINAAVNNFKQTIETGQLSILCQQSKTPDCPWVYESLEKAEVKEIGSNSAIASVDTPNGLRQWLSVRKYNDGWKIMAVSSSQNDAKYKASDERFSAIQEAIEKKKEKLIQTYKMYKIESDEFNKEVEKRKKARDEKEAKTKAIYANIIFSDVKISVEKGKPKFENKEKYLYNISTLIENKNTGEVTNYEIKTILKQGDIIVDSFSFNAGYNDELLPHQKYLKKWKIWSNSLTPEAAQKINDGTYSAVMSIEGLWMDGRLVDNLDTEPYMFGPTKPNGYDEWAQSQK
jgi:hypothetical protein